MTVVGKLLGKLGKHSKWTKAQGVKETQFFRSFCFQKLKHHAILTSMNVSYAWIKAFLFGKRKFVVCRFLCTVNQR